MYDFCDLYSHVPMFGVLIALMVLDVMSGICCAFIQKELSSKLSWAGMSRKAMTLILVAASGLLEPYASPMPLLKIVAGFYSATEVLSILENAGKAGVPIPQSLREALAAIKNMGKSKSPGRR